MPKINVYLPDALAAAVKVSGVPVSAVCQAALKEAVEAVGRTRGAIAALIDPATPEDLVRRIFEGVSQKMTPRLQAAWTIASTDPRSQTKRTVSSLSMLGGVLGEGENLAIRLLAAGGVDVDALEAQCASIRDEELAQLTSIGDEIPAEVSTSIRSVVAAALDVVLELGHNYVGCEHLLVGLASSPSQAKDLLGAYGIDPHALRQAIGAATAGIVHERASAPGSLALTDLTRRLESIERRLTEIGGI